MHRSHRFVVVGSILLVASLFFAVTSFASNAFGATQSTHNDSRASAITRTSASSRLALNTSCPPSCPNPINACPPTLQQGSTGTWVQILDYKLNNADYAGTPLSISTSFTASTKTAVENFQRGVHIPVDGTVGPQTWSYMLFCVAYPLNTVPNRLNTTAHCPAGLSENNKVLTWVMALQDRINFVFYVGDMANSPDRFTPFLASDGVFGAQTKDAVVDLQYAFGQGASGGGAVGNRTWNDLAMCY
jgi:Putative peptidoglycan binding domain